MSQIIAKFEEHEDERLQIFKDAADKIILFETNQEMN